MTRINIFEVDELTGERSLAGWFDPDKAEQFEEPTFWDGNNRRGVISGLQCGHECLYRTKGGRWVRHYDARGEYNGPEYFRFLDDEAAREWLIMAKLDDVVARFFGALEEEHGPGRPAIGPATTVRLEPQLIAELDAARRDGESRAAAIRRILKDALD